MFLQRRELEDLEAQTPCELALVQEPEVMEDKQVPQAEPGTLTYNMLAQQVVPLWASFDYNGLPLNSYKLMGLQL